MKSIATIAAALSLVACSSTPEYLAYTETHRVIAQGKSDAEVARYRALAQIAQQGDTTAKVAAVMSLQMGGQQNSQPAPAIAAPKSAGDTALQWTALLLPNLTQMYGIARNADVAVTNSNNAAATAASTNSAFVGIAGKIQAPIGMQPTVTVTGDYNVGANSGNAGKLAGTTLMDSTSTPTVVTQPTPLVITQPTPLVVTQPAPVIVTQPTPLVVTQPAPMIVTQPTLVGVTQTTPFVTGP